MLTTTFFLSQWWMPDVVTPAIWCYNPTSDNPFDTPFQLLWYRIQYSGRDASLMDTPLKETENPSSEWDTIKYLLKNVNDIFLLCIYCCRPHRTANSLNLSSYANTIIPNIYIFKPLSQLFATSMLILYQSNHVSFSVSSVILIHNPFHLICLIPLSLSTCAPPSIIIRLRLHHTTSIPSPYLL